jgi:hypothetical protein
MMKKLIALIPLILAGCVTVNPVGPGTDKLTRERCHYLGIHAGQNKPMLPVVKEYNVTIGYLQRDENCGQGMFPGNPYAMVTGCIKPADDGTGYLLYHSGGNSKPHEWCHAYYGRFHSRSWMPFEEEYPHLTLGN